LIKENNKLLSREHAHMCLQTRIIKNTSNYEKILYDASKYLTKLGFDAFKKEFISSDMITQSQAIKEVVSPYITKAIQKLLIFFLQKIPDVTLQ